jgi:hypothetical protein
MKVQRDPHMHREMGVGVLVSKGLRILRMVFLIFFRRSWKLGHGVWVQVEQKEEIAVFFAAIMVMQRYFNCNYTQNG